MILISAQAFPPRSGGIQTLMAGLAQAAAQHKDVLVFADKKNEASQDFDAKQSYLVKRFDRLKPFRQYQKVKAIKQQIEAHPVSHLICDSWKSLEPLPSYLNTNIIVYAHGNEFPKDYKKTKRIQKAVRKAHHIIAVSSQTAERLRPFLPTNTPPHIHVMPNPVEVPITPSQKERENMDKVWRPNTTRLLSLCRLIDWKGVDRAILAVKDLKDRGRDIHLIIAGDGDDEPRLRHLVSRNNLEKGVTFIGRIEGAQKTALYQSADIYIQAGRTENDQCEGFGISYIEAGLHGLPSIAGRDGGAPDAVRHEKTGLVVNGDQQENVSSALLRLIDEPNLASHMGKEAQKWASSLLWEEQILRVLNLDTEFKD